MYIKNILTIFNNRCPIKIHHEYKPFRNHKPLTMEIFSLLQVSECIILLYYVRIVLPLTSCVNRVSDNNYTVNVH